MDIVELMQYSKKFPSLLGSGISPIEEKISPPRARTSARPLLVRIVRTDTKKKKSEKNADFLCGVI